MLIRKKGICENPDCDMCITRTVQEIEPGEDFICAECGSPLKEVKENGTKGPGGNGKGMLYAIIAAVVVLGGAAGWWFFGASSDKATPEEEETEVVTEEGQETDVVETTPAQPGTTTTTPGGSTSTTPAPAATPKTGTLTLMNGVYSGPVKGGQPNDMGGEFTVTRAFTLDLKDGYGTTVELAPGDKIITTKFTDGKFRQGEIHFKDGARKYVSGLNQAL